MRPLYLLPALALLGTLLSSELTFGTLVRGPAWGRQSQQAVAFGGGVFLVVWEDERGQGVDLRAARISPQGQLLDPDGILVSSAPSSQLTPTVAFDGTSFVVAWSDRRSDSQGDIYAARVSVSGTVLDPGGIPIAVSAGAQLHPAASALGSETLLVWYDTRGGTGHDVYGARLSSSGSVLPLSQPVATPASPQAPTSAPGLATNGTLFLVAFTTNTGAGDSRAFLVRLAADGSVLDTTSRAVSTGSSEQTYPTVASNGTDFLVGWQDTRTNGDADVLAIRVRADGTLLDSSPITVTSSGGNQKEPRLLFNPARSEYLFTWYDDSSPTRMYASRVSSAGDMLDGGSGVELLRSTLLYTAALAAGAGEVLVVWESAPDSLSVGSMDLSASRLAFPLALRDSPPVAVALSGNGQGSAAVASHAERLHLVGWFDHRTDAPGLQVTPLSPTSSSPVAATSTIPGSARATSLSIAHGEGRHLLAWRSGTLLSSGVQAFRVGEDGTLLDAQPLSLATDVTIAGAPVAAFNGGDFLVLWGEAPFFYRDSELFGARVSPDGGLVGTRFTVSDAGGSQWEPAVACEPSRCLAVWSDTRNDAGTELYGARVRSDAVVEDSTGIPISTGTTWNRGSPEVAYDGTQYWVVWQDDREDGGLEIYGARVLPTGQVLDSTGLKLSQSGGKASAPNVVISGGQAWVVWRDTRTGNAELFARRMRPDGSPRDSSDLRLTATAEGETAPVVAADGDGGVLLLTSRFVPAPPYATQRLVGLRVTEGTGGIGSPCGAPSECQAGVCSGGMCVEPSTLDGGSAVDGGTATDGGSSGPTLQLLRLPAAEAVCGAAYQYGGDGQPLVEGPGPFSWSLVPMSGTDLPPGLAFDPSSGSLVWAPTPAQLGRYDFELRVQGGDGSELRHPFSVEVRCENPQSLLVGCGCGASDLGGASGLLLLGMALMRRRSPSSAPARASAAD